MPWIKADKELPKERDWYLGIFRESDTGWINPIPYICEYRGKVSNHTTKDGWTLKGLTDEPSNVSHEYYRNHECVAWTYLPEPYKEEGETQVAKEGRTIEESYLDSRL